MVALVVARDGEVVASTRLCWSYKPQKYILPKRSPDKERSGEKMWLIVPEDRRKLGKHVVNVLEGYNHDRNHNAEEVHGFFGVVGIGTWWADDMDVDWWLLKTNKQSFDIGETD